MRIPDYYENLMRMALREAEASLLTHDVPVGAVVARHGEPLAYGRNRREERRNALLHAEMEAIGGACRKLGSWRLSECELFVTLEPCPMCAGAIINSRIRTVVIGAPDPKGGACGSVIDLFACPFNHSPRIVTGVLGAECADLLRDFFSNLRNV